MTWGQNPTKGTGPKRMVPYLPFSNSNVKRFAMLPDSDYNVTIITKNGWEEPLEMWTNTVTKNGTFFGQFFSRNIRPNMNECPFAAANLEQLNRNGGVPIENKQRAYPIGKNFVIAVVVDEIPNEPYLLYMVSEKTLEQIKKAFQLANTSPDQTKIKMSRIGSGQQGTTYMYSVTGEGINKQMVDGLQIPTITSETFKEHLIGLENPYSPELNLGLKNPAEQVQQQTNQTQPQGNQQDNASSPYTNQNQTTPQAGAQNTIPDTDEVAQAKTFKIEFGPFAGKTLGEIDEATLQIIADSMDGEIQEKAVLILNKPI